MLAQVDPNDPLTAKPAALPDGAAFQSGPDPRIHKVVISADCKMIAAASGSGSVAIFDAATGTLNKTIAAVEGGECFAVDFTTDGKSIVTGGSDQTLRLWDIASGKEVRKFNGDDGQIKALGCAPDGERVASADTAGTLRIWDLKTGDTLHAITGHGDNLPAGMDTPIIDALAWAPDGRVVVTEANDETARIWDVIGAKQLHVLPLHDGSVAAVAISPNNTVGVSTRGAKTSGTSHLRVWEVATGQIRRVINGHTEDISCVGFAPDGRTVFSGANDLTVRQWDVESGVEIRRFRLSGVPASLACSSNGAFLVVSTPREGVVEFSLRQGPPATKNDVCKDAEDAWARLNSMDYDARAAGFNFFLKALPPTQAVAELTRRGPRARTSDDIQKLRDLIARLDAETYAARATAFSELRAIGGAARSELSEAAGSHPSPEVRARASELLSEIGGPYSPREVLIAEILRTLDTPDARAALVAMPAAGAR